MKKESLIHKILRKLGFIKDIEDDRKLKMEMCERARNANEFIEIGVEIERTLQPCRIGLRNRSMTELLFCMLRSGR